MAALTPFPDESNYSHGASHGFIERQIQICYIKENAKEHVAATVQ